MKVTIPDSLKEPLPNTVWGKMISATPVVMTVIATMLAGLASSEMTQAQYDRSFAAQMQAKAGDQWGFFQAKRLRGSMQLTTLEVIAASHPTARFTRGALESAVASATFEGTPASAWLDSPDHKMTLDVLEKAVLPAGEWDARVPAGLERAFRAMEASDDALLATAVASLSNEDIEQGLTDVRARIAVLDALTKRLGTEIGLLEAAVDNSAAADEATRVGMTLSRLRFSAARYEMEARLNQSVASLYEFKVRKSNVSAERHHIRSVRFFYGMLAAQLAVIVATFALVAKDRSWLWGVSAAAGVIALTIAGYVYLYI